MNIEMYDELAELKDDMKSIERFENRLDNCETKYYTLDEAIVEIKRDCYGERN